MVYTFLFLLTFFVIFLWFFAIKNDFDPSLAEIMYTTIGAALVSSYFLYKAIYIDENEEISVKTPVVVLLDRSTGHFYSMFQNHITSVPEDRNILDGLKTFGSNFTLANKVNNTKAELVAFQQQLVTDRQKTFPNYILESFENELIHWLQLPNQLINISSFFNYHLGAGHSGQAENIEVDKNFIHTNIPLNTSDGLPYLNFSKTIFLRRGASVIREKKEQSRSFFIDNVYSTVDINFQFKSAARPSSFSLDDQRIAKVLGVSIADLEKMDYLLFEVRFDFKTTRWRKLSFKARNDKKWFQKLTNNFTNDFSWNVLKDYYRRSVTLP